MRKLMLLATLVSTLMFSTMASADSSATYFTAVLKSKVLERALKSDTQQAWSIKSITLTNTYRCLGCFRFAVEAQKMSNDGSEMMTRNLGFMTSYNLQTTKITVKAEE